jgi:hypothetical protein
MIHVFKDFLQLRHFAKNLLHLWNRFASACGL